MSTVVDNDKYIINGSTLSAIGDALREAGISNTRTIIETKYYKTDMTGGKERTISASFFTGLNSTPTQAFIRVTRVDSTGTGITSPIRQALNVGDQLTLPLPFKYKGYATTSYGSTVNYYVGLNIYPLDAEGNLMIPENTTGYTAVTTNKKQILPTLVEDIPSLISVPIDYQGLSYGYITTGNTPGFWQDSSKNNYLTYIPLTSGQKIGFCVGETVSNRLRAAFFQGKVYSDFQQYIAQPASSATQIYTDNVNITGTTELSGDGLLKRFYYTAPSNGELIVTTSNNSTSAPLHVWRA